MRTCADVEVVQRDAGVKGSCRRHSLDLDQSPGGLLGEVEGPPD
ncbi:hypothetical protein ACFU9X_25690 [Streptomyces atratus]